MQHDLKLMMMPVHDVSNYQRFGVCINVCVSHAYEEEEEIDTEGDSGILVISITHTDTHAKHRNTK